MTPRPIGVLVDTEDTHLLQIFSPDIAKRSLAQQKDVVILEVPSLNGTNAVDRVKQLCKENGLSKIVVCGPSSETSTLPEYITDYDHKETSVPIIHAAVREHCLWVEKDKEKAAQKAWRILEMAIARARGAIPTIFQEKPVERTVAVVGSNHSAYQMAISLIYSGFPVVLLESESPSGCFYPLPESIVHEVRSSSSIQLVKGASLYQIDGCVGAYQLKVDTPSGRKTFNVGAVVLAIDAQTQVPRLDKTIREDDRLLDLRKYGELLSLGRLSNERICIWLDREGPERRCATQAALHYACEHKSRGGKPTVLFSNMSVYGHRGQVIYDEARAVGVDFIRHNGVPPKITLADKWIKLSVVDTVLPSHTLEMKLDYLIIPAPVKPFAENAKLANLVRQPLDKQGYLQSANIRHRPVGAARRGLFFVGGCHDECDPDDARVEAQAVLAELLAILPEGKVQVPTGRVVMDTNKCANCLTCMRNCPHGAIRPHPSEHRMEILDPACYQCGICAASCPGMAIEHSSLHFNQIHDMLKVATKPLGRHASVVAFACHQSAIPAASGAGREGLTLPTDVLLVDVPCAGLINENMILDAIEQGARGVLVLGCHHDNCRSLWGSDLTRSRVNLLQKRLEEIGVGSDRIHFHTLAANESHRLANLLAQAVKDLPVGKGSG